MEEKFQMLLDLIYRLLAIYEKHGDMPVSIVHQDMTFTKLQDVKIMEFYSENIPDYTETICALLDNFEITEDDIEVLHGD